MAGIIFFIFLSLINNCDLTQKLSMQKLRGELNVVSGILICRPSDSIPQEGIYPM
jgi:hypothetical protein